MEEGLDGHAGTHLGKKRGQNPRPAQAKEGIMEPIVFKGLGASRKRSGLAPQRRDSFIRLAREKSIKQEPGTE